jgi:hypothetical protein
MATSKRTAGRAPKRRAPNLTPDLVSEIVGLIHQWRGRLTWPALIDAIEQSKHVTYTRQALAKHSAISSAYDSYKDLPSPDRPARKRRGGSGEVELVLEELDQAKTEVLRLKAENERLLGQFVRWAYNASQRGLAEDYLNQPLPEAPRKRERDLQRVK